MTFTNHILLQKIREVINSGRVPGSRNLLPGMTPAIKTRFGSIKKACAIVEEMSLPENQAIRRSLKKELQDFMLTHYRIPTNDDFLKYRLSPKEAYVRAFHASCWRELMSTFGYSAIYVGQKKNRCISRKEPSESQMYKLTCPVCIRRCVQITMVKRNHSVQTLAGRLGIEAERLEAYFQGEKDAITLGEFEKMLALLHLRLAKSNSCKSAVRK